MYILLCYTTIIRNTVGTSLRPSSPQTDDEAVNPAYGTITIADDHSKQSVKELIRCYVEVNIPTQSN